MFYCIPVRVSRNVVVMNKREKLGLKVAIYMLLKVIMSGSLEWTTANAQGRC